MVELNLSGLNCPLPILKTKKFLVNIAAGEEVRIITTDPSSVIDLKDFCAKTGHVLIDQEITEDKITTIIQKRR